MHKGSSAGVCDTNMALVKVKYFHISLDVVSMQRQEAYFCIGSNVSLAVD